MHALLSLVVVFALAGLFSGEVNAQQQDEWIPSPPCGAEELPDEDGQCLPFEEAIVGEGGTLYWVNQSHPAASDRNPGTSDLPWLTIGRATGPSVLRPGDAVIVREGVYRESVRPRAGGTGVESRVTFAAYPGETVVVTGADVLPVHLWQQDENGWSQRWERELRAYAGDMGPVMRRELMVVDGEVLRPVFERDDLEPGTFYADGPDRAVRRLVVALPNGNRPQNHVVEAAERTSLFEPRAANGTMVDCGSAAQPAWLRVIGFTFRHATNRAQWGVFCAGRAHGLVEDVIVEWTNGAGFDTSGSDHVFRRNRALNNGQLGFSGSCTDCLFERNEAAYNNWKGYNPFWEAGGGKWTKTSGSRFVGHYAHNNHGPGLWLDIENYDNEIIGGYFVANHMAGIMLELATTGTRVADNTVTGTRWLRWTGTGILSQAASHNHYVNNTVINNEGTGLWLRLDPNRRAPDGNNVVEGNLIAGNATRSDLEAREVSVEGETIEHVRTNRFTGNRFGELPPRTMRSTFFVRPDPDNPAHYRGSDIQRWETLTGSVGDSVVRVEDLSLDLLQE